MIVLSARSEQSRIAPGILHDASCADEKVAEEDQQQQGVVIMKRASDDDDEADVSSTIRPKRPQIPYSQREIYEKKALTAARRPATYQSSSRRTTGSSDGGSTPVHQQAPISSPAYSHSRTISSPSMSNHSASYGGAGPVRHPSTTPTQGSSAGGGAGAARRASAGRRTSGTPTRGSSAGGGAGAARRPTVTPTPEISAGANAAPLCSSVDPASPEGASPAESEHQLQQIVEQSQHSSDPQQQDQPQKQHAPIPIQTPNNSRARDLASPTAGLHYSCTTLPEEGTPNSARPGRPPSDSANRPLPHPQSQSRPQINKASPVKANSCSYMSMSSPLSAKGAPGSPAKCAGGRPASPQPAWNPSTSKTPTPRCNSARATPGSATRPPRKPADASSGASSGGRSSGNAAAVTGHVLAAAADKGGTAASGFQPGLTSIARGQGDSYGRETFSSGLMLTRKCASLKDRIPGAAGDSGYAGKASSTAPARGGGNVDALIKVASGSMALCDGGDVAMDAESLGLLDLETGESGSLCGGNPTHAGVPAKSALLVSAPSCDNGTEGGARALSAGLGEAAQRATAAAMASGKLVEEKGMEEKFPTRPCGCVMM